MADATMAVSTDEKLYEGMFLLDSGAYSADPDGTVAAVLNLLEKSGGTVEAHRPWLEGKLAYAIEGQRKGLHYVVCFRMSDDGRLEDLARSCKLSDLVLRHLVIRHPPAIWNAVVAVLSGESPQAADEEAESDEGSDDDDDDDDSDDD